MPELGTLFDENEFRGRVNRLQMGMRTEAIDCLLLTTAADIFYVTGFLTRFWESPARPWFVLVPAKGDPVALIPAIGAALMSNSWVRDIRTWDAPDPRDDGVSLLVDAIGEIVPADGALGLPMGPETQLRMPIADYQRVKDLIKPRRVVDATGIVQRVREIKSDAEITKIKASCAIADRAFAQVPDFAHEGTPLDQVFRDFQVALLNEGADWISYIAGGASQDGYGDVISPASAKPLMRGDVLMLDTGAVREGYFCDFDRNYAIGPASKAVEQAQEALYSATDVALAMMRPGMTAANLHAILMDALRDTNATPGDGRFGHGLGITLTEWPSITAKDTTVLREGMVLTLEPGVEVFAGKFLVHEENIVLRADGPELLSTRAPQYLPQLS